METILRAKTDSPLTKEKPFYKMRDNKDRFIEFVNEISKEFFDAHIEPQSYYLSDKLGNPILINKFIDFDNLNSDINDMLDIDIVIIHKNKKDVNHKNIIRNYIEDDEVLMQRIKELYKEDFKLYENVRSKSIW